VTPLITPLSDRDTLDVAGLERLVEHVLTGGVHGLFLLGTTGEAAALSAPLHRDLVRHAMRFAAGRVPILVGVSDNSVVESLRLTQEVADLGATAIVLTTPSYLPVEQAEISRYIRLFDRESPLPIMLYNMPRLTSHWFAVETIREAMQLENVIGLKDSSGDMSYFAEVRNLLVERPDWSLFTGPETLLADAVKLGAHGCVGGGSNVWPQLLVDIYNAAVRHNDQRVAFLQQLLLEMGEIYQVGTYATGVIRGIKCALELLGICSGRMADPFAPCDASQREVVEDELRKLRLLGGKSAGFNQLAGRSAVPPLAQVD
jgi:4-hydroxy-tetrahydrodipicolinate synthase